MDCASVNKKIVDQMNAWKSADNCANGGEKCLYTVRNSTVPYDTEIRERKRV